MELFYLLTFAPRLTFDSLRSLRFARDIRLLIYYRVLLVKLVEDHERSPELNEGRSRMVAPRGIEPRFRP